MTVVEPRAAGMSMVDWFAGKALAGLVVNGPDEFDELAAMAYGIGKAMVAESVKRQPPEGAVESVGEPMRMSLLDWFAGEALGHLITEHLHEGEEDDDENNLGYDELAQMAFECGAAMIVEAEQIRNPPESVPEAVEDEEI